MASGPKTMTVWIRADQERCYRMKGIWRFAWWFSLHWHEMSLDQATIGKANTDLFLEIVLDKPDGKIIPQNLTQKASTKWAQSNPLLLSVMNKDRTAPPPREDKDEEEDDGFTRSPDNVESLLKDVDKKRKEEAAEARDEDDTGESKGGDESLSLEDLLSEEETEEEEEGSEEKPEEPLPPAKEAEKKTTKKTPAKKT